jgi:hemerythrin-like domain-containing protein
MLNLNGAFGSGRGFLEGAPAEWARQLADLTLRTGMSSYILSVSSGEDLRRFAEEVAPAVRELVATARGSAEGEAAALAAPAAAPAPGRRDRAPLATAPTPDDGQRLSGEPVWDEATRPAGPPADPAREYTPDEQAAGRHLVDVHDHLRSELDQLRDLVEQVAAGSTDPSSVRSYIQRMTIRQNHWTLGTFCETYCRTVTTHHMLEDRSVFPHLRRSDARLGPVIDRLEAEHVQIHDMLEHVDAALVELVSASGDGIAAVNRAMDVLTDALRSHFSYEERELIEPLARHGFY